MGSALDIWKEAEGKWTPRRGPQILEDLNGRACCYCGARHYYLVFRISGCGRGATLSARCSQCHEKREAFSHEQLAEDIAGTPVQSRYANAR